MLLEVIKDARFILWNVIISESILNRYQNSHYWWIYWSQCAFYLPSIIQTQAKIGWRCFEGDNRNGLKQIIELQTKKFSLSVCVLFFPSHISRRRSPCEVEMVTFHFEFNAHEQTEFAHKTRNENDKTHIQCFSCAEQ